MAHISQKLGVLRKKEGETSWSATRGKDHKTQPLLSCYCSVTEVVSVSETPGTAAHQASPYITISRSLLKLISIESVMPSNHHILCHLLLLPSVFPRISIFSNESALCIRWPKYWSSSISLSNEYSALISNSSALSLLYGTTWTAGNFVAKR